MPSGGDSSVSEFPTVPSSTPILAKDSIDSDSETVDLTADSQSKDSSGDLVYEGSSDSDDTKTVIYDSVPQGSGPLSSLGSGSGSGSGGSERISGSGGSGRTPASHDRLRREWDAAIGTSGKGSGESLRFDRPEASDSVLDRVALRTVANANVDQSEHAKFDYAIQDKLGEGGMGLVFSALQTAVNRVVAFKTLKKDKVIEAATQKQFFYEAEITADLDHPNIPPIYELGATVDGTYFYTMKRIKGSEWVRIMSKRSQEENLEIFEKLADAIGFAHSKQILHLDIKPENVIVGAYGEVYVTDWGLAHNLSKKIPLRCGGTPDYMAPEMARKMVDSVGKQTDIYLLGATLFQIVTGKTPHPGADTKDRKKLAYSKLVDAYHNKIRQTDSDSPVLQVALKAMSTNPADRYATVEDMQAAVREIVRENANIKTSLELTKSSKTTLQLAEKSQDYERFNRAIFGFQNAVEVWTGNKEAEEELSKARLAFGKCAFGKGDYEVAMQTLDRKVPEEATLFDKSQKAKTALLQRESRFKLLRNAVIGLLALGGVGATGAAIWINAARTEAVAQKKEAERQEGIAKANEDKAVANFKEAERQEGIAKANEEKAVANFKEAENQRMIAKANEEKAVANFKEAENQRMIAKTNEEKAVANFNEASRQKGIADMKTKEALARLAQVEVGQQLTNLGFASAQADQANPIGAATLLGNVGFDEKASQAFGDRIPELENWASRRVKLLSNLDLQPQELAGRVTAIDFAKDAKRGIAGLDDGRVVKLEFQDGKLEVQPPKKVGAYILAASISPRGDEVMLSIADNANGSNAKLFRWDLEGELEPMQETATANRFFQQCSYSPDGSKVVAGIRGGIWWKNAGNGWKDLTPKIKGLLLDVDWIDNDSLLVLTENDSSKKRYLHLVRNISSSDSQIESGLVDPPQGLGKITQLGVIGDDKLVVASEGGSMSIHKLEFSTSATGASSESIAKLDNGQSLSKRHRRDIHQIEIDASRRRMVTGSDEAVVHVWRVEPSSGLVDYETFLTGAKGRDSDENTISRTVLIDNQHVVNVDNRGAAVALDIERQKQRRELRPRDYQAVAKGIHPRGKSSKVLSVLSVDSNAVVDLWDLETGTSETIAGNSQLYSYFGHTPGSTLFDTAIDAQKGVVITSAVLTPTAIRYAGVADPKKEWAEFCVWDQASGAMLRRWQVEMSEPSQSTPNEPRLTILGDDKFYVGNDYKTMAFDYEGTQLFTNQEKSGGATFAVVNPVQPNLVGLFRRAGGKGEIRLWNRESGASPQEANAPMGQEGMPVHAIWSEDGKRLYVLDATGKIIPMVVVGDDLRRVESKPADFKDAAIVNVLRSYQDVELMVRSSNGVDTVVCNVRDVSAVNTGTEEKGKTTLFTSEFTFDGDSVVFKSQVQGAPQSGLSWLEDINRGVNPKPLILSKRRAGSQMFVSLKNGRVYGLSEQGNPVLYGRQKFVMSTGDREGNRLMLLHDDGSILELQIKPEGSQWRRVEYKVETGEQRISLSPDGQRLAVYDAERKSIRVLASENGQLLDQFKDVTAFDWDPEQGSRLAILKSDGSLALEGDAQPLADLSAKLGDTWKPVGLSFFEERWSNQTSVKYIVVQTEDQAKDSENGKLFFISRSNEPAVGEDPVVEEEKKPKEIFEGSIAKGVKLSVSPADSLLATGDSTGTIGIWFASPTYGIFSRIYNIDREGASSVERIAFSGDGDTLVTSDQQRVSAWMSRDKLSAAK
jgi:serine/threonine protein kinase